MNKLKELRTKLFAHKVVLGLLGIFVMISVVVAFTGQNNGTVIENQTVQGDFIGAAPIDVIPAFGAFPGPDVFADVNIFGSLIKDSGKAFATTSDKSYTLTVKDLATYSFFSILNDAENGADNISWTMPATSTFNQLLPNIGSTRSWMFHNASSTGTGLFTLIAGTGISLIAVTNADDILDANEAMQVDCTRVIYRGNEMTGGSAGHDSVLNIDVVCTTNELVIAD